MHHSASPGIFGPVRMSSTHRNCKSSIHLDANRAENIIGKLDHFMAVQRVGRGIMDSSQTESCIAAFLRMLTGVYEYVTRQDGRVALCQIRPGCVALAESSGLPKVVDRYGSVEGALDALTVQ